MSSPREVLSANQSFQWKRHSTLTSDVDCVFSEVSIALVTHCIAIPGRNVFGGAFNQPSRFCFPRGSNAASRQLGLNHMNELVVECDGIATAFQQPDGVAPGDSACILGPPICVELVARQGLEEVRQAFDIGQEHHRIRFCGETKACGDVAGELSHLFAQRNTRLRVYVSKGGVVRRPDPRLSPGSVLPHVDGQQIPSR